MAEILVLPLLPERGYVDFLPFCFKLYGAEFGEGIIGVREKRPLLFRGCGGNEVEIARLLAKKQIAAGSPNHEQRISVGTEQLLILLKKRQVHAKILT